MLPLPADSDKERNGLKGKKRFRQPPAPSFIR